MPGAPQASAKLPTIGKIVDHAMVAIGRNNPRLKGGCPRTTPATRSTSTASASSWI
jgi:hypothetical protein